MQDKPLQTESLYDAIGETHLALLVDQFYTLVLEDDVLKPLFKGDINDIKAKQKLFLTQFLGGPMLYSEVYGHPKLRMRHMPHQVTKDSALHWLKCMAEAIETLPLSEALKDELFNRFPKVAEHMINS